MHVLKGDDAIPPRRLKAERYLNSALLLINEVGCRPSDRQEANLLFRLVSARYEKGSIIRTSNEHVSNGPEIFAGDEVLTTAILNRMLHHVHIIHIDGRSYRLREIDGLLRSSPPPTPQPKEVTSIQLEYSVCVTLDVSQLREFECLFTITNADPRRALPGVADAQSGFVTPGPSCAIVPLPRPHPSSST